MKKILIFLVFVLPFYTFSQTTPIAPTVVIENETITGTRHEKASESITIRPNTLIQAGANFTAQILLDPYAAITFSNENYVLVREFQVATQSTTVKNNSDVIESITYLDGLGRPKQSIGIKQSPTKKDIVTHISYDSFGRQVEEYLPYASENTTYGNIKSNAKLATQQYYLSNYAEDFPGITNVNDINAYSKKELENSPLNRVLKQAAPGKDWKLGNGHEIEFDYQTNTTADNVKIFSVTLSNTSGSKVYIPSLSGGTSTYPNGRLMKTITKDENHNGSTSKLHTTEEFKNKSGQVILKRTYALVGATEEAHDTYYVYDDLGNLTYVFPPKVNTADGISTTELSELSYQYVYDYRNRLIRKKIPGKDWEYIIYDRLDRPVLTQDANLRAKKQWLFTKYDALGRAIYTGMYTHSQHIDQPAMQEHLDGINNTATKLYETKLTAAGASGIYYSNTNFPSANTELFTVNYFDNYTFDKAGAPNTAANVTLYKQNGQTATNRLQGLATGTKVKVLDVAGNHWITTTTFYDEKARPIYVYSSNTYLGTTDIVETQLDFVGRVQETRSTHKKAGKADIVVKDFFEYDHTGRLLDQKQQINNQAQESIVANSYDALGQLVSKKVGGNLQTVDYKYNIRGWLTKINEDTNTNDNDLFNFEIKYNDASVAVNKRLYNGNIAQTSWQTANVDKTKKNYTYSYDALNRIIAAIGNTNKYDVSGISYDKMGNILTLTRKGHLNSGASSFGVMDNLVYSYDNGNKLQKVLDNGNDTYGFKDGANVDTEYIYDANGNMVSDANKQISNIQYNHLNLPTRVTIAGKHINYTYDATGMKLRKVVESVTTDYSGNYIYKNNTLQFFNHSEGYTKKDGNTFNNVYQYKDHLGNVRLSYTDANKDGVITPSTEITEESNYYPFGLKQRGGLNDFTKSLGNSTAQKFGYNGKELNEELNLEWYDYGARNYDASLGRWMNIDLLAEQMYSVSPYSYGFNSPIYFFDSDGNIPLPQIINYTRISSSYGIRKHPIHKTYKGHSGVDLAAPSGTNVKAAARGKVVKIGWDHDGYGKYIVIEHAKGYYSLYAHLEKNGTMVVMHQEVDNGQLIATSGNTGGSTGPHLHFEIIQASSLSKIFKKENKVDPESIDDLDVMLHGNPNAFAYEKWINKIIPFSRAPKKCVGCDLYSNGSDVAPDKPASIIPVRPIVTILPSILPKSITPITPVPINPGTILPGSLKPFVPKTPSFKPNRVH